MVNCSCSRFQYSLVWIGAFSGFVGSAVDSLLGATLQYSGNYFLIVQSLAHTYHHLFYSSLPFLELCQRPFPDL